MIFLWLSFCDHHCIYFFLRTFALDPMIYNGPTDLSSEVISQNTLNNIFLDLFEVGPINILSYFYLVTEFCSNQIFAIRGYLQLYLK